MSTYDTSDPDAIRADIERTRAELGQDVDALADKVTPSKVVDREKEKLRGRVEDVKDRIFGAASDAKDAVHGATDSARTSLSDAPGKVAAKAQGNALAVGIIAFGAGLLAAALIPASEKEKQLAAQAKDAAQPAIDEAKDLAQGIAQDLKQPAQEAAEAVRDTAQDAVSTVRDTATDEAHSVRADAEDARDAVQDQTRP